MDLQGTLPECHSCNRWQTRTVPHIGLHLALIAVACTLASATNAAARLEGFDDSDRIPNQFMVLFKSDTIGARIQKSAINKAIADENKQFADYNKNLSIALGKELSAKYHSRNLRTWYAGFQGFLAEMSAADAARMGDDSRIELIEAVRPVYATSFSTQTGAPWHLDRIDQLSYPLNGQYIYIGTGESLVPNAAHLAVFYLFVLDSGIRATHSQFGGRVLPGGDYTVPTTSTSYGLNSSTGDHAMTDPSGHGTFVSALIGGATYGVAKGVYVTPMRVVDQNGVGNSGYLVNALHDITAIVAEVGPTGTVAYYPKQDPNNRYVDAVLVNMSVQSPTPSPMIATAVTDAMNAGAIIISSAGPGPNLPVTNACTYSPAGVSGVITVTSSSRVQSLFSADKDGNGGENYGPCVTMFAPGINITSASSASDTATTTMSGTSFATPLVTGTVALFLNAIPTANEAAVKSMLINTANPGQIQGNLNGSPNLLLYTAVPGNSDPIGGGGPLIPKPPSWASVSAAIDEILLLQ